jgi:ATP-dependent helicase HrpA
LSRDPGSELGQQFPDRLEAGELAFKLSYRFEPGGATDGVTVEVPIGLINRVPRHRFDWLVPGLLRDKCIALVRALPKEVRKKLVPVPDYVDQALAVMQPADTDLMVELAQALSRLAGERIDPGAFRPGALEDFYRMNVRVVDARGRLLEQGRDLPRLLENLREEVRETVQAAGQGSPARRGLTRFDCDDVPRQWRYRQAGVEIQSYPSLVDHGDHVDIELLDYPGLAAVRHRLGVLRLLRLHSATVVKQLRKQLLRGNEFNLLLAAARLEREPLVEDLIDAAYAQSCLADGLPYRRADFEAVLARGRGRVIATAVELETTLRNALDPLAGARRLLSGLAASDYPVSLGDIESQLAALLAPGFNRDTPADWLAQYPRYMKALRTRAERLRGQVAKDVSHTGLLQRLLEPLTTALSGRPSLLQQSPPAAQYRWMLEELRVSLFAQQLGTRSAVSEKRLLGQWGEVEAWLAKNPQ